MEYLIQLLLAGIIGAAYWAFIVSQSSDYGFLETFKQYLKYVWFGFLAFIFLLIVATFLNATGLDSLFKGGSGKFECFYYC